MVGESIDSIYLRNGIGNFVFLWYIRVSPEVVGARARVNAFLARKSNNFSREGINRGVRQEN